MQQSIINVTLVVCDYEEAIEFYTQVLGFNLMEDTDMGNGKHWVRVSPPGNSGTCLLLAQAANAEQASRIGNQTGGRVFLFLQTDDFWRDFPTLKARGLHFIEEPREEPYGVVAIFEDLYGNRWDFIQYTENA
jgi:catechol 2,3-dioxygenase-like lactoylglutathione lyase family enzyme